MTAQCPDCTLTKRCAWFCPVCRAHHPVASLVTDHLEAQASPTLPEEGGAT